MNEVSEYFCKLVDSRAQPPDILRDACVDVRSVRTRAMTSETCDTVLYIATAGSQTLERAT